MNTDPGTVPSSSGSTAALGFATAVSMWGIAYVCRLPAVTAPGWLMLALMLAAVSAWGWHAGRETGTWKTGARAGALAAILNMLILGSLLSDPAGAGLVPSALWWIPGSILVMAALAATSAALGLRSQPAQTEPQDWTALLTKVAMAATLLLVVVGGLVTSNNAGLAVVDWPNTFGYNMFLYPLSRMTGGVYYEHAHRLFGSLVGLTTIAVAVQLWRSDTRRWLQGLGLVAVVLVVVQGVLGGLRVTGSFTLSTSAEAMTPRILLAVIHGVLGQLFFGLMAAIAVLSSRAWKHPDAGSLPRTGHRSLQLLLVLLVTQLVFGAVQRHLAWGLMAHISMAAALIVLAGMCGSLQLGRRWPLHHLGSTLLVMVTIQAVLGIGALLVTSGQPVAAEPSTLEATLTTAHQAGGALLLATVLALTLFASRSSARPEQQLG